jgi:hypothetical protein
MFEYLLITIFKKQFLGIAYLSLPSFHDYLLTLVLSFFLFGA